MLIILEDDEMKAQTTRPTWIAIVSGALFSAAGALATAEDVHSGIILDEAYHDYADVPTVVSRTAPTRYQALTAENRIILDEAVHDYEDEAIAAYDNAQAREQADFAALEERQDPVPWVLKALD